MVAKLFRPLRKFGYPMPFNSSVSGIDNAIRRKSESVVTQLLLLGDLLTLNMNTPAKPYRVYRMTRCAFPNQPIVPAMIEP
jgi:hypothetical protein